MKIKYEELEIDVINISFSDIVTTSQNGPGSIYDEEEGDVERDIKLGL